MHPNDPRAHPIQAPSPLPQLEEELGDPISLADEEWSEDRMTSPARAVRRTEPPKPAPRAVRGPPSEAPLVLGLASVALVAIAATLFVLLVWV